MGSTDAESVASCPSPAPDAVPVRRQLMFADDGAGGDDGFYCLAAEQLEQSYYDSKQRAAHSLPAASPARGGMQCPCGRGPCTIQRAEGGRWQYVCSANLKCSYSSWCDEADLGLSLLLAMGVPVTPSNPCAVDNPNNLRMNATSADNASPQGARSNDQLPQPAIGGSLIPSNPHAFDSPNIQRVNATTPVNVSPQGTTCNGQHLQPIVKSPLRPSNPHAFDGPNHQMGNGTASVNISPQGGRSNEQQRQPLKPNNTHAFNSPSNQRLGAISPVKVSHRGDRFNDQKLICYCGAGECSVVMKKGRNYFTCHIKQGQGACSHFEPVDRAEEPPETGNNYPGEGKHLLYDPADKEANGRNIDEVMENNETGVVNPEQHGDDEWPFDVINDEIIPKAAAAQRSPCAEVVYESPKTLHRPNDIVGTPMKKPMPPNSTRSPITPGSSGCFQCGEEGHWSKNCPRSPCFNCGKAGHWARDCPAQFKRALRG